DDAAALALRDEPPDPVLHPAHGRSDGALLADRQAYALPIQGRGGLLERRCRRSTVRRHRVELPPPDPGVLEDREPAGVLQRAGGRLGGWRTAGAAHQHALVASALAVGVARNKARER